MRSICEESKGLTTQEFALLAETCASELIGKTSDPSLTWAALMAAGSSLPARMPASCCLKESMTC